MRSLILDSRVLGPFEIGARLMAMLAFPAPGEADAMRNAADAWCAIKVQKSPEVAESYPHYWALDARAIRSAVKTTKRRLRDRMIAAWMALGFLQEEIYHVLAKLPPPMLRLSLNEASKAMLKHSGESDPANLKRRAWSQSRSVIHLATAMYIVTEIATPDRTIRSFDYDLDDLALHRWVVAFAAAHAQILASDARLCVPRERLIDLQWIENSSDVAF